MARGLDHIVHAVRDLDAGAELYRRLGFTVGARNRHPWGTHNHIVQLPGFFIEVLTMAEPDKLGDDGFSRLFGAFNRDFLACGDGFSLLILESGDAASDERDFRAAGIAQSPVMRFEREGKRPDGSAVKVAFSLTFAANTSAPANHFCVCQQHYPENFWNTKFQIHANGVRGVAGVVMVAADVTAHRDFLTAYTGVPELHESPGDISAPTPRGVFSVMTPSHFGDEFGVAAPAVKGGARLAALRFACADVGQAATVLGAHGVKFRRHRDGIVVDPANAMGATICFEPLAG